MKLNETVLWVELSGEANLCAREGQDIRHWSILCPFRSDDTQCGSWCPLFELSQVTTCSSSNDVIDTLTTVRMHCGGGMRQFNNLPVVEEVKPCT